MSEYLELADSPAQVKKLSVAQLRTLASEIRQEMINGLAKSGGHLGPNLGVVELSIALHYEASEDGGARLAYGLTRGDGQTGEDVSSNLRTIRSVPLSISPQQLQKAGVPQAFEVRGEVVMPEAAFLKWNQEREKRGKILAVNPRNAAAGAIYLVTRPQQSALCAMPIVVETPRGNPHFAGDGSAAGNYAAYLASRGEGCYS